MLPSEFEFHLEEYKQIRSEVVGMLNKAESFLQYAVVIAAAVFSWVATQIIPAKDKVDISPVAKQMVENSAALAVWIPFFGALILGLLALARYIRVLEIGRYLLQIENALGRADLGWEKFLSRRHKVVAAATILAWVVILISTFFVAYCFNM